MANPILKICHYKNIHTTYWFTLYKKNILVYVKCIYNVDNQNLKILLIPTATKKNYIFGVFIFEIMDMYFLKGIIDMYQCNQR